MEALREMHKEKFLKMSMQNRASALLAACNLETKAILLLTMKQGVPYAQADVVDTIKKCYNLGAMPLIDSTLFDYFKNTLAPISMVVENTKLVNGKHMTAYIKTELGENYGEAMCLRALLLSDILDLPLSKLLGSTQTTGEIRHGYVVAKIIENLYNKGSGCRVTDIANSTGISNGNVSRAVQQLALLGLVKYSSIGGDRYVKGDYLGYAVAVLEDKGKLEMYRADRDALQMDVVAHHPKFTGWGYLEYTLEKSPPKIECKSLAEDLNTTKSNASIVINRLVDLGIYKFAEFGGKKQSACSITENGRYAYETLFGPTLRISENPQSQDALREFNSILEIDEARLITLVGKALDRYNSSKVSYSSKDREALEGAIKLVLRTSGSFMRPKEVKAQLAGKMSQRSKVTISQILNNLHKSGEVEKSGFWHWDNAGRLSRTQNVYYRIFHPIVPVTEERLN